MFDTAFSLEPVSPHDTDVSLTELVSKGLKKAQPAAGARTFVLVVLDGLGWVNLSAHLAYAPNLRRLVREQSAVRSTARSVFPSTTAAAITSLLTGLAPGAHNMVGYAVHDPKVQRSFDLISFKDYPGKVEDFQPQPTWFERLNSQGTCGYALGPQKFVGRGLSLAALRGAEYVASENLEQRAIDALNLANSGGFVYFYVADVDHAGHGYGVGSERWLEKLESADQAVGILLDGAPAGTEIVITADHGMINTSADETTDLINTPAARLITHANGEGRVLHLHTPSPQLLATELRAALPNAQVFERQETAHLFFQHNLTEVRRPELLGDVTVVSGGTSQVLDSRFFAPQVFRMVGIHGGLSETEMRVPRLEYRR